MERTLEGKVALVTGGSHGFGRTICLALAAEGARVGVNYRQSAEKAEAVVAEIAEAHGVEAVATPGDVANEADIAPMFDAVERAFGPIDILVNNAGICPVSFIKDASADLWQSTIQTNLTGTFFCCRELVRRATAAKRPGRIINIVSQAAFNGSGTGKAHYAASKAGVVALTVSLAREMAGCGITANAVAPGMMLTEMTRETLEKNAERYRKTIPLGRVAEMAEIAGVVTFLASDKASYMTGATVDVSGGMLMR